MSEPVCIIVTAWNQVDKTIACLETVFAQDYPTLSALLVDNGSTDDTVTQVSGRFPQTQILSLPKNLGPTGGYNAGFRHALDQGYNLLFLLNNDTLLAPDCIRHLVAEAETSADIGLVMPKIYYAADPQRIWSVGGWHNPLNLEVRRPGNNQLDTGQYATPLDIDDAPFCAVLLTRSLLKAIGLPDESFYLYYEDLDFCQRAREAGFRLRLAPAAHLWHVVSVSSGGSDSPGERYWMARSSLVYFRKHTRRWHWFVVIPWRTGSAIRTSARLLRQRKVASLKAYWRGLRDGLRDGPPHPT
jgi:GT2 family glycosyltransferase